MVTFIVDCPVCKAKVAAEESGRAEHHWIDYDTNEPFGNRLLIGKCPRCATLIGGKSYQTGFQDVDSEFDEWSEVERIYPNPSKVFTSSLIPTSVLQSLSEGEKSLQAGAPSAACVMFGRALEAVCHHKLVDPKAPKSKQLMLGEGIKQLKAKDFIDQRLFDWSRQLQAFRNLGAHPGGGTISREDAEDLQAFVYAIIEYIYDLTDRYEEFKLRVDKRSKKKTP